MKLDKLVPTVFANGHLALSIDEERSPALRAMADAIHVLNSRLAATEAALREQGWWQCHQTGVWHPKIDKSVDVPSPLAEVDGCFRFSLEGIYKFADLEQFENFCWESLKMEQMTPFRFILQVLRAAQQSKTRYGGESETPLIRDCVAQLRELYDPKTEKCPWPNDIGYTQRKTA